ncbi:hypothetical protein K440DRAFT_591515 [Wilcoxina mikolae CBS 423.85]|nr:hypothetical protein K440DRAFT_591515 [Wilcoxina mikolae CBS 423.85]
MAKKKKQRQLSQTSLPGDTTGSPPALPGDNAIPDSQPPCPPPGKGKQPTIRPPLSRKTTAPIDAKQHSRFSGSVLLLHSLDPVRGARKGRPKFPDPDGLDSDELLCSFPDAVSYACDRRHGGDTVTAAALQDTPEGPVLLLASNSQMKESTKEGMEDMLKELAVFEFGKESVEKERELENGIVRKLSFLAKDRLKEYQKRAQKILKDAERTLKGLDETSTEFLRCLSLILLDDDSERIIFSCYEAVRRSEMVHLRDNVENQRRNSKIISDIRHYIGRLGYHVSVAKILIRTARDPSNTRLFPELRVEVIPSSPVESGPLTPETSTPDYLISHIFQKDNKEHYTNLLHSYNSKFNLNLPERLKDKHSFRTRTHAELLVIDYIRTHNLHFYNPHMRYVGCSKAACYLCYRYVNAMKGERFHLRGSHEKMYLAWRPPDIPYNCGELEERHAERRDILNEMKERMSREIMTILERGDKRRPMHPDSTTGVSTVTPFSGLGHERSGLFRTIDTALSDRMR